MSLPARVPFTGEYTPGSEISLVVCQGIGDIIWVWQKFYPFFDRINLTILSVTDGVVCRRAMPWLKLLPKVGEVSFRVDHPHRYRDLAAKPSVMQEVYDAWKQGTKNIEYACNKWLEEGVRLDEIDPGSRIIDRLEWTGKEHETPFPDYLTLFVSGDTRHETLRRDSAHHLWGVGEWAQYVEGVQTKYGLNLPVVVIGANFDREIISPLRDALKSRGIASAEMIGEAPEKVCHLLAKTKMLVAYQSGLSVVADLLGTKQVMLFFPILKPMSYAFCRRDHIGTKFFADTFASTPKQVLDSHELFSQPGVME